MARVYLGRAGGQEGSYLQEFTEVLPQSRCVLQCTWNDDVLNYHFTCHVLQKVMTFTRRMARKLSCMRAEMHKGRRLTDQRGPVQDKPVPGIRRHLTDQRAPVQDLGLRKAARMEVMMTPMIHRMSMTSLGVPNFLMLLIPPKVRCVSIHMSFFLMNLSCSRF